MAKRLNEHNVRECITSFEQFIETKDYKYPTQSFIHIERDREIDRERSKRLGLLTHWLHDMVTWLVF